MKKLVLVFLLSPFVNAQSNYFPLEVGNYWQFKATHYSSLGSTMVSYDFMKVLKDTLIGCSTELFKKVKSIILAPYFTDSIHYLRYDSTLLSIIELRCLGDTSKHSF